MNKKLEDLMKQLPPLPKAGANPTIGFKPRISINAIFTYDYKPQEMLNLEMKVGDINADEAEFIEKLLLDIFKDELCCLDDICKLSLCIGCENEDFIKLPIIKKIFNKGGKYYFDSEQRDEVEEKIFQGIAEKIRLAS